MIKINKEELIKIAIGSLALIIILGFVAWTQSDNNGQISQQNQKQSQKAPLTTKQFESNYITFDYSSQYLIRDIQDKADELELFEFGADKPYPKKIAVSISDLPDGTLKSNSAYLLRKTAADKFFERKLVPNEPNAEIWSSNDGTKQTVFIVKNGRAAVLAFTQDGGDKNQYNDEVNKIIWSFEWK